MINTVLLKSNMLNYHQRVVELFLIQMNSIWEKGRFLKRSNLRIWRIQIVMMMRVGWTKVATTSCHVWMHFGFFKKSSLSKPHFHISILEEHELNWQSTKWNMDNERTNEMQMYLFIICWSLPKNNSVPYQFCTLLTNAASNINWKNPKT